MLFSQLFSIFLTLGSYSCTKVIDEENLQIINNSSLSDELMETQHTNCRISSSQLSADAQTTITRIQTGRCNAKIINERLTNLENLLTSRFDEMQELIYRMNNLPRQEKNDCDCDCAKNQFNESPRGWEIKKFNNTIYKVTHSNGVRKVFIYYWTIIDITKKLWTWKTGDSERSSTFYIKPAGYAMFFKFTPKYFPDGTIFTSVGLTSGINDEHLTWPFAHHLQIEILDESPGHLQQPMRSRLWNPTTVCPKISNGRPVVLRDNPECVGISLPRYFLLSTKKFLLWNDSLTVKLTIHL